MSNSDSTNRKLYNYADNNTLSRSDKFVDVVIQSLQEDSKSLINWFATNIQKIGQAIDLGQKTYDKNIIFFKMVSQ